MEELAAILALVLKNTTPTPDTKDPAKQSKAKYVIVGKARTEAHGRVEALLSRFPVYPELDLELLKKAFLS
jgi:glycine hydroxymethyltransferase